MSRQVSILVLLDWLFRQNQQRQQSQYQDKVSILVLLDWLFRRLELMDPGFTDVMFQSLFYWTGYLDMKSCESNVVIAETFQSLFYWTGYLDTFLVLMFNSFLLKFQSLFYWTGYLDLPPPGLQIAQNIVSILVLLDWLFRLRKVSIQQSTSFGFNPCSIGLVIQTGIKTEGTERVKGVSILVLLDWLFRPCSSSPHPQYEQVSILVLLDWLFRQNQSRNRKSG